MNMEPTAPPLHTEDAATAWMADGNCRLYPPATFFPSDGVGVDSFASATTVVPSMAAPWILVPPRSIPTIVGVVLAPVGGIGRCLLVGHAEVPLEQQALALRVAGDALAVAAELRIVAWQQDEAGQHASAELVEHLAVAPVAVDLPVRRHGAEVDDPGVGSGWLVDGRVSHGVESLPPTTLAGPKNVTVA